MRGDFDVLGLVRRADEDVIKHDDVSAAPAHLLERQHLGEPDEEILRFLADVRLERAHQALLLLHLVADSVA